MNKYLNLGCGGRFHPTWTNINFVPSGKDVIAYNLALGIPFPNSAFKVVYHSHLLEHFPKNQAEYFLRECHRVLVDGGIIRIAVPDLESIAKEYLHALERAREGSKEWIANYDWLLLEMYDQTVRNYRGGAMAEYLMRRNITNEEYVINRCGTEVQKLLETSKCKYIKSSDKISQETSKRKTMDILRYLRNIPQRIREYTIRFLLGPEYKALEIGRFRLSGEIHQWMYDFYSLKCLLEKCNFTEIIQRTAMESYIPNWSSFNLDTEPDGSIYKPDSFYMEAIKL